MTDPTPAINPLSVLTRAPAGMVKALAEDLIPHLGDIRVLQNRTGLVMIPATDSVTGVIFHLGEALVAEAHIRASTPAGTTEGYAVCLGRDLEQAMGIAVIDAALRAGIDAERIRAFIDQQAQVQQAEDEALLRRVAMTEVHMETF